MAQKNDSRRVRMTKLMMKNALLELMDHQSLINITVTAICETADVHRSTFYNYYKDPAELLWDIEQDFLNRIPAPPDNLDQKNQKSLIAATTKFFDYIQENKKQIRILFNESCGDGFAMRLREHLFHGFIPVDEDLDELTVRYTQLYIANGAVGILREWIYSDFSISSVRIAEMMYSLSRRIASPPD